ncbi:ATP-binding protein [Flavobacterium sp.]|uniref:ATP-binding response regulator n=1 Tax=Flavobacterium sp. TaxID=239 RepID=UPI00286D292C|nr:ATP-binding protein [Flavobacterium sp.]
MITKKSNIPIKILLSYLALSLLAFIVGWILYSENKVFYNTESKISNDKTKILKVSNLLSNLYKTESLARQTIQSNSEIDFDNYKKQTDSLKTEIDSLKLSVTTQYQKTLLDSLKYLLGTKTANILQLKSIKNKANSEVSVKNAINNLTRMELSLSKLRVEDLVKNPSSMGSYQLNVLKKYVSVLNQNIPDDSTNTLSKRASDSILLASKTLLNNVKKETAKRKIAASIEENKLLENEFSISEQSRKILNIIEQEIILNNTKNDFEKENSLRKTNNIVTIAAIIGLVLTLFFSILIINDFSKTESYKTQLEIANTKTKTLLKNREQLISTVSHDLKTPLSTIVGYAELLGNSELNKKQSYFTQNIKGSSEYISKLVQDLLDFTQIEAGKIAIESISFSLNEILNDVAKSIQSIYSHKNIELIINLDKKLENKIIGDPFRLRQILSNIIGNAYKFTESGIIKIDAEVISDASFILIKVKDSGIGIHEKNQELIFQEFTQADENIEKKYGGTGLGLTISKKIIEILGGKLTLQSTFGQGSVFNIQIPLKYDVSVHTQKQVQVLNNKILTAVILDDDLNLLNLTAEVLKQNNYNVLKFTNATDALEAIKNEPFDILITDIQMPNIDGFEFISLLKNSKSNYKNQPVIALTGRTDLATEIYMIRGFDAVINKPYTPKNLIAIIDAIINKSEIINPIIHEVKEYDFEQVYNLDNLKEFLPNKENALEEIISIFISDTNQNLLNLKNAISNKNMDQVKEISHKMGPMFKQINAFEVSTILDKFENNEMRTIELRDDFEKLETKIKNLLALIEQEIH